MKFRSKGLAMALAVGMCGAAMAADPTLKEIVAGLGHGEFKERETAQRALGKWPLGRMEEVVRAAVSEVDPEVKARLLLGVRGLGVRVLEERLRDTQENWPRIKGRLLDGEGHGVKGGPVRLGMPLGKDVTRWSGVEWRGETDGEGWFEVAVPLAEKEYVLIAQTKEGGVPLQRVMPGEAGKEWMVAGAMMRREIQGRLVDEGGKGVAGEVVTLKSDDGWELSARTKDGGAFTWTIPGVCREAVAVAQVGDKAAEVRGFDPMAEQEIKVVLAAKQTVKGRALARDGRGLSGVRVGLYPGLSRRAIYETMTDAKGAFVIEGVGRGGYRIEAEGIMHDMAGSPTAHGNGGPMLMTAGPGEEAIVLGMVEKSMIVGQVLDEKGRAVARAVVEEPEVVGPHLGRMVHAVANEAGVFVMAFQTKGPCELKVHGGATGTGAASVDFSREGETVVGVKVVLKQAEK